LSAIWTLCGLATAGPWAAGIWADHAGSFVKPLMALALLPLLLVPATLCLRVSERNDADFGKARKSLLF